GQSLLQHNLEQWLEIVKTREYLPESIEKMFDNNSVCKIGSEYASSSIVMSPMSCQNMSCNTSPTIGGMRKTQSIDSSYLDLRDYEDAPYPRPLSRAKSDFNLTSSSASLVSSDYGANTVLFVACVQLACRRIGWEHQLSFHEGDVIILIGDRNKGWQYGENLRNHRVGWFPIAYTEPILDSSESEEQSSGSPERSQWGENSRMYPSMSGSPLSRTPRRPSSSYTLSSHALPPDPPAIHTPARPHSTFTDSPLFSTKEIGPKATPVKTKQAPRTPLHDVNHQTTATTPASTTTTYASIKFHHPPLQELQETPQIFRSPRRSLTAPFPISVPPPNPPSLHSSNDSGFCNESSPTPLSQSEGATVEEGANATDKESR
ncbi:SH3 domain-containing protein, partial [Caerostris darwini]